VTAKPNTYDVGDRVVMTGLFTNENGVPTNPTTATCRVLLPDGTTSDIAPTQVAPTGTYEAAMVITMPGDHWYRFVGVGTVQAMGEYVFAVRKPKVP
jgi:hypothetical protein